MTVSAPVSAHLRKTRLPSEMYWLAGGVILDLSADSFVIFSIFWIAGPQGWTGAKTAAVIVALRLPALMGGWLGGRGVDKWGPKPMMIVQAVLRIGCLTGLAICAWSGRYPLDVVLVLGGVSGAVVPISYAGARTMVPRLLPSEQLSTANSLLAVGDQAALVVGAAFVGPLLGAVGSGKALLAPIGMLVAAVVVFSRLPSVPTPPGDCVTPTSESLPTADESTPSGRQLRSPWKLRPVVGLVALSGIYYFAYGPFEPALPYYTRSQLHAGSTAYTTLWVLFGLGAVAGLGLAPRLSRHRPGVVNATGAALWGVVTLPLVFCTSLIPAAIVMTVSGAVWGPYLAVETTALQRWTSPSLHGRLFGTQHALLAVATPLGAAAGSIALVTLSSGRVLSIAIVGSLVAGLAALCSSAIRVGTSQLLCDTPVYEIPGSGACRFL